jgi:hypothetical protein
MPKKRKRPGEVPSRFVFREIDRYFFEVFFVVFFAAGFFAVFAAVFFVAVFFFAAMFPPTMCVSEITQRSSDVRMVVIAQIRVNEPERPFAHPSAAR